MPGGRNIENREANPKPEKYHYTKWEHIQADAIPLPQLTDCTYELPDVLVAMANVKTNWKPFQRLRSGYYRNYKKGGNIRYTHFVL